MLKTVYKDEKKPHINSNELGIDLSVCDGIAPGVNKRVASCQGLAVAAGPSYTGSLTG